jgi:3-oxoacyl-(acyl-carrier-protein) synthase III
MARARVLGISAYLPPRRRTSAEVEDLVAAASPSYRVRPGLIQALTGIRERRVADPGTHSSDLAAEAARRVCQTTGTDAGEVDQVVFASASQDLIEPATANIVQEKVGTRAPVFDVKNACNSFLNGLEVAEAMVASGARRCVLVAAGETCSNAISWKVDDDADFKLSFPGYTLGDAGAAALVVPSNDARGIFFRSFTTVSRYWPLATLPGGGSMHPHSAEHTYIRGDGALLREACLTEGPHILARALREAGRGIDDFRRLFVHQVSMPYLRDFTRVSGARLDQIELTIPCYGNMAAASLPVALALAQTRRAVGPGDDVLLVGLASGLSIGVLMMRL